MESFDQSYVTRLTQGDPDTERHFTTFFGELLLLKLRAKVRTRHAIDDIRQEVFLRVLNTLRRKGGIDHPERFGAFVNSVCNNVLLEFYRSDSRTSPMPEDGFDPVAPGVNIESELVTAQRKQHVRMILEELPEKDREILRLVFLQGLDKDEVCRKFGVDRDYLRVLLHRAKNKLREGLRKAGLVVARMFL